MSNGYVFPFENLLQCSICQDRLKDARSLPCGHTFCGDCLTRAGGFRGSVKCSECQRSHPVPTNANGAGFPRCFVINNLLDEIAQTFGQLGTSRSVGQGFQTKEMLSCSICLELMKDARYLPCGHTFCLQCSTRQADSSDSPRGAIKCCKCTRVHNLPSTGVAGLPRAYRINSIATEIRSNQSDTSSVGCGHEDGNLRTRRPACPGSSDGPVRTTTLMQDVAEEKRQAQARATQMQLLVKLTDGRTITIDISAGDTVGELKKRIYAKTSMATTQQSLTWSGRPLYNDLETLGGIGIKNMNTIHMTGRLRGGLA